MNGEVLNSWKEIAAYLGRGVRTVQRWERELSLPVRRPRGRDRSAVLALKPDLDQWLRDTPHKREAHPSQLDRNRAKLLHNTQLLKLRSTQVAAQLERLHAKLAESVALAAAFNQRRQYPANGILSVASAEPVTPRQEPLGGNGRAAS